MKPEQALSDMRIIAKSNTYDKKLFITIYQYVVETPLPKVEVSSPMSDIEKVFKSLCVELIKRKDTKDFEKFGHLIIDLEKEEFLNFIDGFDERKSLKENLILL